MGHQCCVTSFPPTPILSSERSQPPYGACRPSTEEFGACYLALSALRHRVLTSPSEGTFLACWRPDLQSCGIAPRFVKLADLTESTMRLSFGPLLVLLLSIDLISQNEAVNNTSLISFVDFTSDTGGKCGKEGGTPPFRTTDCTL
ncbi:hypothetical protein ECG_07703 [Echinococcus granulosus]|uniref:Uncharacterized protein n=1 Tax=Echinococcus granulosus TaxID=6210 RepID=A0A068WVC6_ECHGR|nr:hypothetical protein ECG_07703 [Echinococcus granulosus]CDS22426.1 hypothetical protein EgrG_000363000 [Echinococcus granulosus]